MSQHPELSRLDGMDIYADETVDGIYHLITLRLINTWNMFSFSSAIIFV